MQLEFEYGLEMMSANLPDNTDVFIPGETVPDPPCLPQDWDTLYNATLESIRHPIGMETLDKLVKKGSKITIVIPDIVKGGCQPTAHRKVSITAILNELYSFGVEKRDILLLFSNGLHPRTNEAEARKILGDDLFNEFWYSGQITSHDSEDPENIVDLGFDELGDAVVINKAVYDADLAILIGHTQGNPYGGYSGGYKHCATGITNWKSIASHHIPSVMHKPDFVPVTGHSVMRTKFDMIGQHMEKCMGKKFFCCDAVLDTYARQIAVYSGWAKEMMPVSWKIANQRTYVPFAKKKYDILIFGMPRDFHYGPGMGTNPIQMMQALSAQVIRHKRIMSDNCVIICSSLCDGWFNEERFPYAKELFDLYTEKCSILPDMAQYAEEYANRQDYVNKYRYEGAFHPYHAFSMMSCGHIAEMNTSAIYIVGAKKPGIARSLGLKTRSSFEEALEDAKKIVGDHPNILALPKTFTVGAVHLCMADDDISTV